MGVFKEIDIMVKEGQKDPFTLIREFSGVSFEKYGSYAHAAGYLGAVLCNALNDMKGEAKRSILQAIAERIVLDKKDETVA